MEHLRRLAQFLLASARGDGAGRRRPGPGRRRRRRLGARRHGDPSPPAPRRSAPGPLTPLLAGVSAAASVQPLVRDPQLRLGGEEPLDDLDACSVDHNHCFGKKAAWIGDMYFALGSSKAAIFAHLY
ncbi:hypothetical protein ACQJBY_066850 [Aegilops geniculata]